MLTGETIVCFSSIDWDASWQVHQEVTSRLAAGGNRVVFVETTGVRRPELADLPRLARRFRNWRSRRAATPRPPGVEVLSPLALPFPYSPAAVAVNAVALGRRLRGALARAGGARPIVWTFLPTPIVERLLSALDPRLVIYHAADDFSSSSRGAAPIVASEGRLMARADVVFATSARLEARARRHNAVVHLVPAGVTFDRFERARQAGGDPPPDLAPALRPTVGYVGSVNRRIDDVLVAGVARRLPAASFVFVGPIEAPLPALAGLPNVRLLGPRRHEDVPRYIGGFDAAIIPFRVTDYTHHIYPVKLNEYLAMGVPVVSTRLEEVVRFADEHPDVVALADGDEAFAAALEAAAADRDPDRRARRVEVARESDWSARMASMTGAIEQALAAGRRDGRADR